MNIDSIVNGIVLDHIPAGQCMDIYLYLGLDELDCSVAIIKNVKSSKMGRKDIIKIADRIDLDVDVLGVIDPNITVNIIESGEKVRKFRPGLPQRVVNVLQCRNPRCITTAEPQLDQIFDLRDEEHHVYRCAYCETASKRLGKQ